LVRERLVVEARDECKCACCEVWPISGKQFQMSV
jgi:hypothetical protein